MKAQYFVGGSGLIIDEPTAEKIQVPLSATDFASARKFAEENNWGFVVKKDADFRGCPRYTILGWGVEIMDYNTAIERFVEDKSLRGSLVYRHEQGKNEVILWDEKHRFLYPICGINYCRIH